MFLTQMSPILISTVNRKHGQDAVQSMSLDGTISYSPQRIDKCQIDKKKKVSF